MKALRITSALVCLLLGSTAFAQSKPDSLGLPGDNFDLYGALELFKKSATPEEFEKALNTNDNEVNNLDLDGDGKVDYVKVIDKQDGDAHTLVLQVDVSATEKQDVAVIEIEKTGTDKAHIQIVGDEELYGKNYIIEPTETKAGEKQDEKKLARSSDSGIQGSNDDVYSNSSNSNRGTGNNSNSSGDGSTTNNYVTNNYYDNNTINPNPAVIVNVWGWPSVRYIYGPSYAVWVSPWYWNTYPVWWNPWAPVYWRYHYRRSWRYHYPYYHRVGYYRSPGVHNWYYGRRMSSQTVRGHRESGFYNQKQIMYKNNVQPGRKYNNMPARQDGYHKQNTGQPQRMNNGVRQQNNLQNQQGVRQQPMRQNNGGLQQQQPVRQQPMHKQPMQQQPMRQQMQQQPMKQQSMPRQNGGGMRNGGGGVRSGGGSMHNGSGAMHRR